MGTGGVCRANVTLQCHFGEDFRHNGSSKVCKSMFDAPATLLGSLVVDRIQEVYLKSTIVAYTATSPTRQR